jgi:crotonobetainyl-CoA:carnitine CoA-transferase CaiB-like acyl-CoA transferase
MQSFLKDIKVLELAGVLAGPAVGTFLAELGADVIKIESPNGDVTRSWKLEKEDKSTNVSAYFSSVNYGKKYLTLDLRDEKQKQEFYSLVKTADIVITNYKKGDDVKLGVDYSTLQHLKPGIIHASINGYGEESERTAFDAVLQAETGFMSMNGTMESGPIKMPVALIDVLAAHQLKEGILVALLNKFKTGKGAKVSVSLYDTAVASLMNQGSNWLMAGEIPKRKGSLHPNIAPYGETILCSDKKYIIFAVGNNKQFEQLCKVLNWENFIGFDKFSTNQNRIKHRAALYQFLTLKLKGDTSENWSRKFKESNIPHGIIRNLKEVFEDKQAAALVKTEIINGVETKRVQNSIFKIVVE